MKCCIEDLKRHRECINEDKINICIRCKRFYINLPCDLLDLFKKVKK